MIDFKNCEGVVFDLDGTLVDSMWVWEDIDNEFLEVINISDKNNSFCTVFKKNIKKKIILDIIKKYI